jgi:uncharacterized protein (DUF608 family)
MASGKNKGRPPAELSGVPLGGIGAGGIELGRDAKFRNLTINNNRTAASRIPVANGSFCALRVLRRGKVLARLLHPDTTLPFDGAGVVPTFTPTEQLSWRGLYPCAHYQLSDKQFPVTIRWTAFAPIIPHNMATSTLPAVLLAFQLQNTGETVLDASIVLNWENLCGCTRTAAPEDRGLVRTVLSRPNGEFLLAGQDGTGSEKDLVSAGLWFGMDGPFEHNAQGNYCLVAEPHADFRLSVMNWNERSPESLADFWERFYHEGDLRDDVPGKPEDHSGAICCTVTLPPGEQRGSLMALSWYCPRFVVEDADMGNGYAAQYDGALTVAKAALRGGLKYFHAVDGWQQRLVRSSLPDWFSKALINCNSVLTTNSLLTRNGRFGMMESASEPLTGALDRRLYSSLATLLLFPELEQRELTLFAGMQDPNEPGRLFRHLGTGCLHRPTHGLRDAAGLDANIKFVLQAYRNYQMTGNEKLAKTVFPRVQQAMAWLSRQARDGKALPEQEGPSTMYDDWGVHGAASYTSTLWIVALQAYARMARLLGYPDEAERYQRMIPVALDRLEESLWDDTVGYYRFCSRADSQGPKEDVGAACHTGQLAGRWYAGFLCLGYPVPEEHVKKAMEAICTLNERRQGVIEGVMPGGGLCPSLQGRAGKTGAEWCWPGFSIAHFSCLLIQHRYPDRGLYSVMNAIREIHHRHGRLFNAPMCWDLWEHHAVGPHQDRHISVASLWHVLLALQGFYLSVPEKTVWLRPSLPSGTQAFDSPLVTPLGMGQIKLAEDTQKGYRLRVDLRFDFPAQLSDIVLRLPAGVEAVALHCHLNEVPLSQTHQMLRDGPERLLRVHLVNTAQFPGALTLTLEQTEGKKK